jgi:hypothetical protein
MKVRCPQCGSENIIEQKDVIYVQCAFCKSSLYFTRGRAVEHYVLVPNIAPKTVPGLLQTWCKEQEIYGKLTITRLERVYVPVWKIMFRDGTSRVLSASLQYFSGLSDLGIPSGTLRYFEPQLLQDEHVLDVDMDLEPVISRISRGSDMMSQNLQDLVRDEAEEQEQSRTIETDFREATLFHLPFYVIDYTCDGRAYSVTMEAAAGHFVASETPPSFKGTRTMTYGLITVAALLAFLIEGLLIPDFWLAVGVGGCTFLGFYIPVRVYYSAQQR